MPSFTIHTVNSTYSTELTLPDEPNFDTAHAAGIRGALMIARDEVHAGSAAAAVEVIVEDHEGHQVRRSVVSVSVAPLVTEPARLPVGDGNS
jgi:hypothetical protein